MKRIPALLLIPTLAAAALAAAPPTSLPTTSTTRPTALATATAPDPNQIFPAADTPYSLKLNSTLVDANHNANFDFHILYNKRTLSDYSVFPNSATTATLTFGDTKVETPIKIQGKNLIIRNLHLPDNVTNVDRFSVTIELSTVREFKTLTFDNLTQDPAGPFRCGPFEIKTHGTETTFTHEVAALPRFQDDHQTFHASGPLDFVDHRLPWTTLLRDDGSRFDTNTRLTNVTNDTSATITHGPYFYALGNTPVSAPIRYPLKLSVEIPSKATAQKVAFELTDLKIPAPSVTRLPAFPAIPDQSQDLPYLLNFFTSKVEPNRHLSLSYLVVREGKYMLSGSGVYANSASTATLTFGNTKIEVPVKAQSQDVDILHIPIPDNATQIDRLSLSVEFSKVSLYKPLILEIPSKEPSAPLPCGPFEIKTKGTDNSFTYEVLELPEFKKDHDAYRATGPFDFVDHRLTWIIATHGDNQRIGNAFGEINDTHALMTQQIDGGLDRNIKYPVKLTVINPAKATTKTQTFELINIPLPPDLLPKKAAGATVPATQSTAPLPPAPATAPAPEKILLAKDTPFVPRLRNFARLDSGKASVTFDLLDLDPPLPDSHPQRPNAASDATVLVGNSKSDARATVDWRGITLDNFPLAPDTQKIDRLSFTVQLATVTEFKVFAFKKAAADSPAPFRCGPFEITASGKPESLSLTIAALPEFQKDHDAYHAAGPFNFVDHAYATRAIYVTESTGDLCYIANTALDDRAATLTFLPKPRSDPLPRPPRGVPIPPPATTPSAQTIRYPVTLIVQIPVKVSTQKISFDADNITIPHAAINK